MKIKFSTDEQGKVDISTSLDNYNQPAELTMLEKQVALYIKNAFLKNDIDFDKTIRFRRRSQCYLTLIAPNDVDFCRIKAGIKSVWFSVDSWLLDEEKKNDIRFDNVKNRKARHWKVELNYIQDFENNADLIVDTFKSLNFSNIINDESKVELYNLKSIIPFIQKYKSNSIMSNDIINNYTVIDLETTGLNTNECEIIELAAVMIRNNEVFDTFSTLVKPNNEIPYIVTQKTNITNEMVEDAPTINDVFEKYLEFIGNDIILGHNIDTFDLPILHRYCKKLSLEPLNNDSLDTLKFARKCDIDVPNYKLTTLTKHFNIEHKDSHRALNDCIANFKCYEILKPKYTGNSKTTSKASQSKTINNNKLSSCSLHEEYSNISEKNIVLTGDFKIGKRNEIKTFLEDNGASVKNSVSGKTNYVIVGSLGSEDWKFGNYGEKLKRLLTFNLKAKI